MIDLLPIAVLLSAFAACPGPGGDAVSRAAAQVALFDLPGAIANLTPVAPTCPEADIARRYLQGLMAAREAYRYGGSPESLVPVRAAIGALEPYAQEILPAEIARLVLLAASAAAQSEREEMRLFLEEARRLELQVRGSGNAGAPLVSALEIAGDLWLQVHRFEDARAAYIEAADQVGRTRRITLGLARAASRLKDIESACDGYRALASDWPGSATAPPELAEARAFLRRPECRSTMSPRRR